MTVFKMRSYKKTTGHPLPPTAITAKSPPHPPSGSFGGEGSRVPGEKNPLPVHLVELLDQAHAGQLQKGAVKLSSGLVTDLKSYVLAWAECWPRDRLHVLSRLEEAYAVTNTKMPGAKLPGDLEDPLDEYKAVPKQRL